MMTMTPDARVFMRYVAPSEDRRATSFTAAAHRRVGVYVETVRDRAVATVFAAPSEIARTAPNPRDGVRFSLPNVWPSEEIMLSNRDWCMMVRWWRRPVAEGGAGGWLRDDDGWP